MTSGKRTVTVSVNVCTLVYYNCSCSALHHRQACFVQPLECQLDIALSKVSRCKYRGLNKLFIFELHRHSLKILRMMVTRPKQTKRVGTVTEYRIVTKQKRSLSKTWHHSYHACIYEQMVIFMALIFNNINLHINITYFKFWCQWLCFLFVFILWSTEMSSGFLNNIVVIHLDV